MTLVLHDGVVAASVQASSRGNFDIRAVGVNVCLARELDIPSLAACGSSQCGAGQTMSHAAVRNRSSASRSAGVGHRCDDGSVIDLLVVYTEAARVAAGGVPQIEAQIELAVADANAAFSRSQIETSIRLVHSEEVAYTETGVADVDGLRLVDPDDGFLDGVHPLRDQFGADCVSLWVNTLNTGGIGYFPDPSFEGIGASGFSMLRLDNAALLTLAHELGHNLYCAHDRPNAPDPPFDEYSYGYVEPGGAWQTIMAVSATDRIPYFANPNVSWPGPDPPNPGPTGVHVWQPEPCDVALTINEMRLWVANFRASAIPALPPVLYVRADAPAGGDGQSWTSALNDLTDAICTAAGSGGSVDEIWVAGGVYRPDRGSGDRGATFHLTDGVALYGGFSGNETLLSQRDVIANPTVLSGDIGTTGIDTDNCYHVVTGSLSDSTAVLDGFTITGGNADGTDPDDGGGGILVYGGGTPTFRNCTVTGNAAARFGAALYSFDGSSPTLESCILEGNSVSGTTWPEGGGAICNYSNCHPQLIGCAVSGNSARLGAGMASFFDCNPVVAASTFEQNAGVANSEGGALYNYSYCNPVLDQCVLSGNSAEFGGAMASFFDCVPKLTNCTIRGNASVNDGGGVYNYSNSDAELINCLFSGNSAGFGGAMVNLFGSDAVVTNCTVSGNLAGVAGGGIYNYESDPSLANGVLWYNAVGAVLDEPAQIYNFDSTPTVNHCTIQGWTGSLGGTNNNGDDPQFRDADGADDAFGTNDDNPRLRRGSPAIDSGDNAYVPPGVLTDLDVFFADCSAGPESAPQPSPPAAVQECLDAFDADTDGDVDLDDYAAFAAVFLNTL